MPRLACLALFALTALSGDRWKLYHSGPFQVYTEGAGRDAQLTLNQLCQYRHALGATVGIPDLEPLWPIRIVLLKTPGPSASTSLRLGRDAFTGALPQSKNGLPAALLTEVGRLLLDGSAGRIPAPFENGLLAVFSTLNVAGTRLTIGALPPEPGRTPEWALFHLLMTSEEHSGKVRVMLSNLRQGVDPEPAFRNAFGKTANELQKEAGARLHSGSVPSASLSGWPVDPERDFRVKPQDDGSGSVLLADILLASGKLAEARSAYTAARQADPKLPEPSECLGFVALAENRDADARRHFQDAIAAGSRNARVHVGTGAYEAAAKLNPRWAEPVAHMAAAAKDPKRKAALLESAAQLDRRSGSRWIDLAQWQFGQKLFPESARSWVMAERAAATEDERLRIRKMRIAMEDQRAEAEAAEKRRIAAGKERELQKLKDEALNRIREAEMRANRGKAGQPPGNVEEWWTEEIDGKLRGALERVDCLAASARLHVRGEDGKVLQLMVRETTRVVAAGGGDGQFSCGPQRPPRKVSIDYRKKADAKAGTAGEAALVEFR